MNFAQLNEWCHRNKNVPTDNNQPFVVSYQIKIDDDEDGTIQFPEDINISIRSLSFRIFVTTPRLMTLVSDAKYIQADSTYKLIWNNFPVQVVGLASPVESVNKRKRITENVDEILEEQDGTRQTRSKADNLIKSTAQSSSHSATLEKFRNSYLVILEAKNN
ncbi:hypothetical protein BpHYR1_035336 [Brachionus plicatilis]|uniref:Uncharacterized protein n=1 Tax=Brachionus plicatilis TaxID=10195 RepID=A0A3M7SA57_BRAPC|nr:hypothetical protein BpHYR1_035336 [Brachionus plicatilis]